MLIRREDFGDVELLKSGSHKRVWFTCEKCDIGVLQEWRTYIKQSPGKLCRSCRNKHTASRTDVKAKQSKATKDKWSCEKYRRHMSKVLSEACKDAWNKDDGTRRNRMKVNNPMFNKKVVMKMSINKAIPITELKDICNEYGYIYIDRIFGRRGGQVIVFKCNNGHIQEKRLDSFRRGSYGCYECTKSFSVHEKEIAEFVKSLGFDIIENDKSIIYPKEIDIVVPSKMLGIEFCGLYWHGERRGKSNRYHFNKMILCKEKGYNLVTIFEDEWLYKSNIVKERLKYILGIYKGKGLYARDCIINPIDTSIARDFIDRHHIQGYTGSNIKLGAFFNEELVSVMTFSKGSISKGSKNIEGVWEISRFCTSGSVVGIAGKFIEYFKRYNKWSKIFSYADRRWGDGKLYEKIGFEKKRSTLPNYWYFKNQKRYHRFNFRRDRLNGEGTEWNIMQKNGWDRIWDCGSNKFEIKNPEK